MPQVSIKDPRYEKPITYALEQREINGLEKVVKPLLTRDDEDYFIVIDGGEGTGKSTLAFQLGKFYDPTLTTDRVVFTPEEFREAVYKAKKNQCIIFDEAFTGFSSRSSLSGVNRMLTSLVMQMRQKNLFVIIVLPTIFLLDKYISIFRTRVLFHVYKNKTRKGYYRVYFKKKKQALVMHKDAKTYSYGIRSSLKGRFYGVFALGDDKEQEKYRNKKMKALEEAQMNPINASSVKNREQRDIMVFILRKQLKLSYRALSELLETYGFTISYVQIASICAKFGDESAKEVIAKEEEQENKLKEAKLEKKKAKKKVKEPLVEEKASEEEIEARFKELAEEVNQSEVDLEDLE